MNRLFDIAKACGGDGFEMVELKNDAKRVTGRELPLKGAASSGIPAPQVYRINEGE